MKHTNEELYCLVYNNKRIYCTKEFLNANDIIIPNGARERAILSKTHKLLAWHCYSLPCTARVKVYDTFETFYVYSYGSCTWFETVEERDEYRAIMNSKK